MLFIHAFIYLFIDLFIILYIIYLYFLSGRQYDKRGNVRQWWSDTDIEKFKQAAQCFIDQYSNYTIAGTNVSYYTP